MLRRRSAFAALAKALSPCVLRHGDAALCRSAVPLLTLPHRFPLAASPCWLLCAGGHRGFAAGARGGAAKGITPSAAQASAAAPGGKRALVLSPNLLAEPYRLPARLPLAASLFTLAGWRARRSWLLSALKNVYTLARLRQGVPGWSLSGFKAEAEAMHAVLSAAIASGDRHAVRNLCTESVQSAVRREVEARTAGGWARIAWSREGVDSIRLLHGRLLVPNPKDTSSAFAQLTVELRTRQRFSAYDRGGALVAGDPGAVLPVTERWCVRAVSGQPGCRRLRSPPPFLAPALVRVLERLIGPGLPEAVKRWRLAARLGDAAG